MKSAVERPHLGHNGHVKVAQAKANTLQIDHVDVCQGDNSEGHLYELHHAIYCGHNEACGAVGNATEAQVSEGDLKFQA